MARFTRRHYLQGAAAALAGSALPAPAAEPSGSLIQLAEILNPGQTSRLRLAKQIGVNHAIVGVNLQKYRREEYADAIARTKSEIESAGLIMAGVESHPVVAEKIKLGLPGRDDEIENYKWAIHALAKNGVPLICYNWMAGLGWYRTKGDVLERGGALTSEFDYETAQAQGLTEWGQISEEKIWSNMEYFQRAVMPAAEKAGIKMALHPDDPPISPLRGIGRILTSAANYRRVMDIVPSPINGVTFCQANFKLMGEDIETLAKEWCLKKKIFFVHFRDVEGDKRHFRETFHDDGPTDMVRMLEIYNEYGFHGPMRPDHAPTMEGESNDHPGYAMVGKVFAIAYMKGIMRAKGIPYA
jgi:mannonate dehydratase